ncbi:ABC transporter permease [Streptococcus salivarius]|uniref:ABC transporter permease n=1 Tax=Streptococcus salivarius TaxID=1304 RepID=UPI001173EAC7|nr:ABC-2 family transporter protein [Streptococcus salivarius]VUW83538.1 ABC-2 family transporter protein [Streptococcus thermophilus]
MKFNKRLYIKNCLKELITSGIIIIGVIVALIPPVILMYYIINYGSHSFYIKHISNFFCIFGLYIGVLSPLYFINRDFSMDTITLVCNTKENRIAYLNANVLLAFFLSLFYSLIGVATVLIANNLGVTGDLNINFIIGFFCNLTITIVFYYLFSYLLFSFLIKSNVVFSLLTLLLLFIPNMISNILYSTQNELLNNLFEKIPMYFLPIYAGSNIMEGSQYIISILSICILYTLSMKKTINLTF